MVRNRDNAPPIDLDVVSQTLTLDGSELLDKVTLVLHQAYNTSCTCLIETDRINMRASTLSYACNNMLSTPNEYSLLGTPCAAVTQSDLDCIIYDGNVVERFPTDDYLKENSIVSYIGVPLRSEAGDVLGVLLSTFSHPLSGADEQIYYHKLFARIVVHHLRVKWLAARSDSLVNQLSYEVSHDNLTGLLNRSFLADRLECLTEVGTQPFTLAYIDVDNFKSINDLYGNYIGDQIIKFVATAIQESITDKQLAFRIAGDEFAFISLSGDPFEICNRIIERLNQGYQDPAHNIKIKVSIGIARHTSHSLNADQIMLNASLALKECKQSRHLSIQCYDTHLSAQYYRRAMIIDALRSELDPGNQQNEIFVVAQPIVTRNSPQWKYFEILARWNSQALGSISPIEFIEAAEQSGLIIELGERIVELACEAKQTLEQGLGYKIRLGLNCSAHELNNSNRYLQHLLKTVNQYNFHPDEFTIELTETVLLSRTKEVKTVLDKLRLLGFTIALDDFGTGYSSLNYIHSYPIDCIKIDATFIRNMLTNATSESVVWLIIQLAKRLKVNLVAEGVEDQKALEKLYAMGCEQIQGYYFSRPELPEEIVMVQNASLDKSQQVSNG